jgi:hypothetical protein
MCTPYQFHNWVVASAAWWKGAYQVRIDEASRHVGPAFHHHMRIAKEYHDRMVKAGGAAVHKAEVVQLKEVKT